MANLHRVRNQKMRADQLLIHPRAQRERSNGHIKRLCEKLDLDAIGTIHAVEYSINGKTGPWVVDGQHRILALIERGMGEWEVQVAIHVDIKNDARASELFLSLNTRLNVGPYDRFINELSAGHDEAVGVTDIAKKFGLAISKQSGDGLLACVMSLKKTYKFDDGKALTRALEWGTQAWGKRAAGLEGKVIEGLSLVARSNNGNVDNSAMIHKLAKYQGGPSAMLGDSKGRVEYLGGSLSRAVAATVIDTYNLGRRAGKLDPL